MRLPLIRVDTTTAMYKSLLGIHNAYAIGSPATALVFEYGPPRADKGSLRRLRVDIDAEGRMSGAEVSLHCRPAESRLFLTLPSPASPPAAP